jgi:hypothetical protein
MMPQGSSLKGKYDSDVIAAIVETRQQEEMANVTDPLTEIAEFKIDKPEGFVLFSDVFWKPKEIPDIAFPMFKLEDWDEEAQFHIPAVDPHWIWNKKVTEKFALAMSCGDTTLLHGLQGTGKSCLAEQWCAKFIIPAWRMSCNRETREGHFLGSPGVEYDAEGKMFIKQEPTLLTDSLKYGGMFIEDEAFRHNAALVLQSLREKNTRSLMLPDAPGRTSADRKLTAPVGRWWYVLTDNTCGSGDETGIFDAEVQDASTLDRVGASIEVKYLSKAQERRILKKHCDLNIQIIDGMLEFAKLVRLAFEDQTLLSTFSVRSLLAWVEKTAMTGSIELGLQLTWYDKLCGDDKATVRDMFHQVFERTL